MNSRTSNSDLESDLLCKGESITLDAILSVFKEVILVVLTCNW